MAQYALDHAAGAKVMQFAELDSDKWRQYAEVAGPLGRWIYAREAERLLAFEDRVARVHRPYHERLRQQSSWTWRSPARRRARNFASAAPSHWHRRRSSSRTISREK